VKRGSFFLSMAAVAGLATATGVHLLLEEPEGLVLRVNLPEYRLEVWDGGELLRSFEVTIGTPGYDTPIGEFGIDRVVWNPWWHPPESRWAEGLEVVPPGPDNPMGRAKLRFEGLLFIHGTNREDQLGQARSHGCLRMGNADVLTLARLVAEHAGVPGPEELEALETDSHATRDVSLETPVPLVITYRLVEEVGGQIRSYEDVYRRGLRPEERRLLESADPAG
jgi:murein L,D-transpeptidase YcbB/YkuD